MTDLPPAPSTRDGTGQGTLALVMMPVTHFHWPLLPSASCSSGPRGVTTEGITCSTQLHSTVPWSAETRQACIPVSALSLTSYLGSHFISRCLSFLLIFKWEQ